MDNDIKRENEMLKKQLAGFREVHQAFTEIFAGGPQEQKEVMICRQFGKISGADETTLFLFNRKTERFEFRASTGEKARKYAGGVLETGGAEFHEPGEPNLKAAPSENITVRTQDSIYEFRSVSIMVVPVTAFSGVSGILFSEYDNPHAISDGETIELIRVFLNHLRPLFECYAETRHLEEKAKSLELLYEIGSRLSTIRDEDQLLGTILELIEKHLQVDRCSLMIMDEERKYLKIKKSFGISDPDILKVKVPLGQGIAGYVATGTRPLLIKDIAAEKHLISQVPAKNSFRTTSLLSVPLVSRGEVIGVINVNNRKDGRPFSEEDSDLLFKIGSEIASILQKSYMALQLKKARELDGDIKRFMI